MGNPLIWYFENSRKGIVVGNLRHFEVWPDCSGISFYSLNGYTTHIRDKEDVENFVKNFFDESRE